MAGREVEVGTYLTKAPERKGEIEIVRGAKLKLRRSAVEIAGDYLSRLATGPSISSVIN